jgi:hypothetical protein
MQSWESMYCVGCVSEARSAAPAEETLNANAARQMSALPTATLCLEEEFHIYLNSLILLVGALIASTKT